MKQEKLYFIPEVALILKLSEYTVREKIHKGDFGPVCKFGTRYQIPESGLKKYIDDHTSIPGGKAVQATYPRRRARHAPAPKL